MDFEKAITTRGWTTESGSRYKAMDLKFEDLVGKTIMKVIGLEKDSECVAFLFDDGTAFVMEHQQDCCESVYIKDIEGTAEMLEGALITFAQESSKDGDDPACEEWTFYKLATLKGYVDITWFGESNGYYSTSCNTIHLTKEDVQATIDRAEEYERAAEERSVQAAIRAKAQAAARPTFLPNIFGTMS